MVITLSESHVNSLNLEDSDYYELSKYDNLIGARYVLLCGDLIGASNIPTYHSMR